jgi:hypothetical protein
MIPCKSQFTGSVRSVALCAVLLACLLLVPAGCGGFRGGVPSTVQEGSCDFKKIAVVPVKRVPPEDPRQQFAQCPLTGAFYRNCGVPGETAERDLEELFIGELASKRQYVLIPPERVDGVHRRVRAASFKKTTREELRTVGEELGADGVIAGYVFCYAERKGYTYAAEQPASVVFVFHLLRVSDGEVVWTGIFDKTQESLMHNILDLRAFFRGGGKWITVKKLAAQGIKEVLQTFPERE